ncbi:MAG: ABC transporter ATP-binding protein [Fimbriimonadaceae bacterium]
MLTINNLQAQVNPNFQLGPLSFQAKTNQIIVILGENGSGKTSLFRALLGEIPSQGIAHLDDLDLIHSKPGNRAERVSLVPQIESVPFHFTVKETVLMGCLPYNQSRWESQEDHSKADQALETLQILHIKDRFIHELSGGERQKTLIARSLAQEPQLLLLDEPTAHVDLKTRSNLQNLVPQLTKSRITLVTTHDLAWGTSIADHCLIFQNGKIVASSSPDSLNAKQLTEIFSTHIEISKTKAGRTYAHPAE